MLKRGYHHQHNVFGFDVAMQHLVAMHVVEGLQEMLGDVGGGLFSHALVVGDEGVELAVAAELHQLIEMRFVMKEPIHRDNIGVIKKRLDAELPDKLVQEGLLDNLPLLDDLHRHHKASRNFLNHEDLTEFPLAQLAYNFEILCFVPRGPQPQLPQVRGQRRDGRQRLRSPVLLQEQLCVDFQVLG